ncbi:diadenylate cyclase CdaA [Bacteroidales bacterium OttesenSCG-928-A17]|nr:diadenylate cyclase CdaA [Bacteroidales bacterium OttesenSCG-928-A17]
MIFNFGIKDLIDVLLVAFFLYETYILMKKTGTTAIFLGVLAFIGLWILVSQVFEMRLMGAILDKFISVGLLVLVIVFQREIREFLKALGSNKGIQYIIKLFRPKGHVETDQASPAVMSIVLAAMDMSKRKEGALIAIEGDDLLDRFVETGELINANISTRLIVNIFFKNSPLHDGAMVIAGKKIKAAGCILPVSQKQDIPKQFGLRHRAALGLSQETDAKVIIVSEETGKISFAYKGKLHSNVSGEDLQKKIASI